MPWLPSSFLPRTLIILFLPYLPSEAADFTEYLTGNAEDKPVEPEYGVLLAGGGGDVDDAFRWFLEKAGGGDVLVLRASGKDGYNDWLFRELGVEVNSVRTVVFHRKPKETPLEVINWIQSAEAIFIAGGDQSRYFDYWQHNAVGDALKEHIARGKPIGGTSAGLAVLGEFSYAARHRENLTSRIALDHPAHPTITLEHGFLVPDVLRGTLTDSHFTERARLGRLIVMLAHAQRCAAGPVLGLGIDEATAVCIESDGQAKILSEADGTVSLVEVDPLPDDFDRNPPFGPATARVILLDVNSSYNFRTRSVSRPAAVQAIAVADGFLKPLSTPPTE